MVYKDFDFNLNNFGTNKEYFDENAFILAIKNILLTTPGNFPFNPSFGMNIGKYQFDFLDDITIEAIKKELLENLYRYIPSLDNLNIDVKKIENNGISYLGISLATNFSDEEKIINFLLFNNNGIIDVIDEVY